MSSQYELDGVEFLPQRLTAPLDIPADMVLAMARGMEDPEVIAGRFGFDGKRWEELSTWKPFLDSVEAQKAELEANGYTLKIKARVLTEHVFEEAYRIAASNNSTLTQKLEFIKTGMELGGMKDKQAAQVDNANSKFNVVINLGTYGDLSPKPRVVDVETKQVAE